MASIGVFMVLLGGFLTWYFIKKEKNPKRRNWSIALLVLGFIIVGSTNPEATEEVTAESTIESAVESTVESTISSSELKAIEESKEAERLAKEEEEAERKKQEEEEAKKLLEELEKQEAALKDPSAYNSGLTFEDLARNPDSHIGEKVTFFGKVIQVIESDEGYTQYRFAVNEDYDTVVYLEISQDLLESRILEDDLLTIYGESYGTISYDSTLGGKITVPAIVVNMFDFN